MDQATPAKPQIIASYSDEWADIYMRDDHIAEIHLRPKGYTKKIVNQIIERTRSMDSHTQLLVLILAHPKSSVDLGGIRRLFSRQSLTYSVAKAYVIHKPVHFFLAKICLAIYRPKMPIRFFRSRAEAETYLSSFIGYGI